MSKNFEDEICCLKIHQHTLNFREQLQSPRIVGKFTQRLSSFESAQKFVTTLWQFNVDSLSLLFPHKQNERTAHEIYHRGVRPIEFELCRAFNRAWIPRWVPLNTPLCQDPGVRPEGIPCQSFAWTIPTPNAKKYIFLIQLNTLKVIVPF